MAKKKMTPAQAAAARRPDDWEPPKTKSKPSKEKQAIDEIRPTGIKDSLRKLTSVGLPFVILFVVMAIVAPFIVIYMSQLLGIQ